MTIREEIEQSISERIVVGGLRAVRSFVKEIGIMDRNPHAVLKKYVGSEETYSYCPDCLKTYGGEETAGKKSLIEAACRADVTEQDEIEGSS